MDITLSFLAKSLDKHSITLVHITYLPESYQHSDQESLSLLAKMATVKSAEPGNNSFSINHTTRHRSEPPPPEPSKPAQAPTPQQCKVG